MGVDYMNCGTCDEIICDAGEYYYCANCERHICEECFPVHKKKYGCNRDGDLNECDSCSKKTLKLRIAKVEKELAELKSQL